jgi:signal transduction histidine kinase
MTTTDFTIMSIAVLTLGIATISACFHPPELAAQAIQAAGDFAAAVAIFSYYRKCRRERQASWLAIQEAKAAKAELLQLKDAQSRFIDEMNRDMRQPLHAMALFLALLPNKVRTINADGTRLLDLLNQSFSQLCDLFNDRMALTSLEHFKHRQASTPPQHADQPWQLSKAA